MKLKMQNIKKHLGKATITVLTMLCMVLTMIVSTVKADDLGENNEGYQVVVTVDNSVPTVGDTVRLIAKVTYNGEEVTDLEAKGLNLWWWADQWMSGHEDGKLDASFGNYSNGKAHSLQVDVTFPSVGNYYIAITLEDTANGNATLFKDTVITLQTKEDTQVEDSSDAVEAPINVEKVSNLSQDFIMGMDISSVMSELASGVVYKDFDGNEINNIIDFCKFLKEECGITHVRVRMWNNPYDAMGNGYGGGNNDVQTAVKIAEGCAAAGLKMLVNFHYSDFWADPAKQQAPKAWSNYTVEQKAEAMKVFTQDALNSIIATGATVDMVQIGNETTGGFVGEWNIENMCKLFQAGSTAVRELNKQIKVVIHVTNPEKGMMTTWAKRLADYGIDYDVLATSYYPYWHGTFANLQNEFNIVKDTYGKDVMVAETSYAYSLADTDGHANTVSVGGNDSVTSYPFTVQGQADYMRDLIHAVNEAGGLGVYYWEPAWITVGDTTGLSGEDYDAQVAKNKEIWKTYGSGWASQYSEEYDPEDAGKWYGGSAIDNQAMFYADGAPTASLKVWDYVKTGAVSNQVSVEGIESLEETVKNGSAYTLPEKVLVTYNQGAVEEAVTWNEEDIKAIDTTVVGEYKVRGVVTFSKSVTSGYYADRTQAEVIFTVIVLPVNLILNDDDAGFEKGDNFIINGAGVKDIPSGEDVLEGNGTLHWYSTTAEVTTVTYNEVIELEAGKYTFDAIAMGAVGDNVLLQILDKNDEVLFEGEEAELAGWTLNAQECENPSVTFALDKITSVKLRVVVDMGIEGWGSVDRLRLIKHNEAYHNNGDETHNIYCLDCNEILESNVPCTMEITAIIQEENDEGIILIRSCICGAQRKETVEIEISGIENEILLTVHDTSKLVPVITPILVPDEIAVFKEYKSSNEEVITVDEEGIVTALSEGNAYITYIVNGTLLIDGVEQNFVIAKQSVRAIVTNDDMVTGDDENKGDDVVSEDDGNKGDDIISEDNGNKGDDVISEDNGNKGDDAVSEDNKNKGDDIVSEDNEKNNETSEDVNLDKEIQTGDSTDIVKWVVITIVAMASIFIVIFTRKKKSKRMK